jgi:hypothetical protein
MVRHEKLIQTSGCESLPASVVADSLVSSLVLSIGLPLCTLLAMFALQQVREYGRLYQRGAPPAVSPDSLRPGNPISQQKVVDSIRIARLYRAA